MIKKNLKMLVLTSVVILLPILAWLVLWNKLPDQIATHFNAQGIADGFSSKAFAVFGLPTVLFLLHWICTVASSADPKSKNYSNKMLTIVLWICPMLSLFISSIIYTYTMGVGVDISLIMMLFLGVMFIIIGNYLPKCKQNYTMGIKLPWTLNDEENWNFTHRISGKLWVAGGIIILVTAAFRQIWIFIAILLLMVIIPFVLSYLFYRKKNKNA